MFNFSAGHCRQGVGDAAAKQQMVSEMRILNKEETKAVSGGFFCGIVSSIIRFKVGVIGGLLGCFTGGRGYGHGGHGGHGGRGC
jgi:hypothetical protein